MTVELRVPEMGESIREVQIGRWLIEEGGAAVQDAPVVEVESDKATVEVGAPAAGTLTKRLKQSGETAQVGEVIALIEEGAIAAPPAAKKSAPKPDVAPAPTPKREAVSASSEEETELDEPETFEDSPASPDVSRSAREPGQRIMPAARRILAEYGLSPGDVVATGPGGRLLKEDAIRAVEGRNALRRDPSEATPRIPRPAAPSIPTTGASTAAAHSSVTTPLEREEEAISMSPMRRRIAERLVQAQQNAALLTTFNEVDLSEINALRERHKQEFLEQHRVKLGYMSFFVKAAVSALKTVPQLNAEVRGNDIVYFKYCDIGVAIGGGKGLVVPVLRSAERMSFAQIERAIADYGLRAKENKISLEELQGGTFTISNGGIYGSMLSTPIVNPPQSGILGMHAIQDRPIALNGQVVIRPMMYVALTYDHRIVDGREAVTFLKHVKECIEAPSRLMLDL